MIQICQHNISPCVWAVEHLLCNKTDLRQTDTVEKKVLGLRGSQNRYIPPKIQHSFSPYHNFLYNTYVSERRK